MLLQNNLPPADAKRLNLDAKGFTATVLNVANDEYQPQVEAVYAKNIKASICDVTVVQNPHLQVGEAGSTSLVALLDSAVLQVLQERLHLEVNAAQIKKLPVYIEVQSAKKGESLMRADQLHFLLGQEILLENFACVKKIENDDHVNHASKPDSVTSALASERTHKKAKL